MVDLVDINSNYTASMKYIIKFLCGITRSVTTDFLKSSNVPDITSIYISSEDYVNKSKNLIQEQI